METLKRTAFISLIFVVALFTQPACVTLQPKEPGLKGNGPPDHAPAHGKRKKEAKKPQMIFDSNLRVYVAVDIPNLYFFNNKYFKLDGDAWKVRIGEEGSWETASESQLPPGLKKKADGKSKGKGKGKGKKKGHKGKGHGGKGKKWD